MPWSPHPYMGCCQVWVPDPPSPDPPLPGSHSPDPRLSDSASPDSLSPDFPLPDKALPSIEAGVKEEPRGLQRSTSPRVVITPNNTRRSWSIFRGESASCPPYNTGGDGVDRLSDGFIQLTHFANKRHRSDSNEAEGSDTEDSDTEDSLLEQFSVKRNSAGNDAFTTPPPCKRQKTERESSTEFYRKHEEQLPTHQRFGKRHDWSFEEREALCLINIFYDCDPAFKDITKILNVDFPGEPFRPRPVRAQWDAMRYIFRERYVYDPMEAWAKKRAVYEAAASRAGVSLRLRYSPLRQKKASPKAPTVVEQVARYDAWFLGQLIRQRNLHGSQVDSSDLQSEASPLAGRSTYGNYSAISELWAAASTDISVLTESVQEGSAQEGPVQEMPIQETPAEQLLLPLQPGFEQEQALKVSTPESTNSDTPPLSGGNAPLFTHSCRNDNNNKPALLYRVYTTESGGYNSPTSFRAGLFNIPGQSLVPPPTTSDLLPVFVSWHLWHHSVSSPFISCTDSLIWAIHKARAAEAQGLDPHIAVIHADRALAGGGGYHAGPLVAAARARGLVPGMRYKGWREWLIWGEIATPAIAFDLRFADLRTLAASDLGVADLLALDVIDPEGSVSSIRRQLLGQEVLLDAAGGYALGRLVGRFGLGVFGLGVYTALEEVAQLVFDVLQGWVLGVVEQEVEGMAECFVQGLKGVEAVVLLDDGEEEALKTAFVGAVERASRELRKERGRR